MAIYHQDIAEIELNSGSLHRSFLGHSIGMGDAAANRFGVRVFRDGVAETLSGVTCQGFFRNANGQNIALTSYGTISGNVAYVTLPQACYNVEGRFTLAIKLVGGGVTGTMRIVDGMVDNTNTGSAVAPTGSVPTYQEVLSVYEQMQTTLSNYNAKVTEQDEKINDLKSAIDELISFKNVVAASAGNEYIDFQITNGHEYEIISSSASIISIATVNASNTTIQNVGNTTTGNNKKITFTATADAPKMLFYFRASGTAKIEDLNLRVPVLESKMKAAESNIASLLATQDDYNAYNEEINRKFVNAGASGNFYVSYEIKKGNIYKFRTTSETNSVTISTVDSNNTKIEDVGTLSTGTHSVIFIPTANAEKIWFYFRAAGYGSVTEISADALPWAGKVWSCFGDSISWNYGWQLLVCIQLSFNDWVRNGKPGARISWVNSTFGIDANGIYTTGTPADTVHESLCAYDRISKTIDNTLSLIFVMGGTNDFLSDIEIGDLTFNASSETDAAWHTENAIGDYNISTLKGGMASMFMKLQYHAPNALIVFGTLCNGIGETAGVNQYAESVNNASLKPSDYAKAEKEVCEVFGIPYIDVFGECGINITNRANYISDTVHPNDAGNKLLARCVASGLNKMLSL